MDNSEDKDADVNVSSTFYFKLSNNSNLVTISSIYAVPIDASGAPISSSVGLSKGQSYNWNISAAKTYKFYCNGDTHSTTQTKTVLFKTSTSESTQASLTNFDYINEFRISVSPYYSQTIYISAYEATNYACMRVNYHNSGSTNAISLSFSASSGVKYNKWAVSNDYIFIAAPLVSSGSTLKLNISRSNTSYDYYISNGSTPTTSSSVNTYTYNWNHYGYGSASFKIIDIYVCQRYSVSYNKNGATGGSAPTTQYKKHGTAVILAGSAFSKSGYRQSGWNTKADGTGTNYNYNVTYSPNASITLYAKWTANIFTLTANANGGVISGGKECSETSGISNLKVEMVNSGYGFSTNSNGFWESENKGVNSSYSICKVSFNAVESRAKLTLHLINFAEPTYDFGLISLLDSQLTESNAIDTVNVFWSGSGKQQSEIQKVSFTDISQGSHYFYVKYRKDGSVNKDNDSLQFYIDQPWADSSSTAKTKTLYYNSKFGDFPSATRTGYTFNGWYTAASGGTSVSTSNKITANATIYAQWTLNSYWNDIDIYSPSGVQDYASGTMDLYFSSTTIGDGISFTGLTNEPDPNRGQPKIYAYYGSYIRISNIQPATGMHIDRVTTNGRAIKEENGVYTLDVYEDTNIYIYMAWNTYKVNYYYLGTDGGTYLTQNCVYGQTYNYLTANDISSNTAYGWEESVVGWADSTSSTTATYTAGASFSNLTTTNGGIVERYAISKRTVYLTYNGNGGSGSLARGTATQYGNIFGAPFVSTVDIAAANNGFTRNGYRFKEWGTSVSGGTKYTAGQNVNLWTTYSSAQTQTLYAQWELITHTVTIYPYVSNTKGLEYVRGVPESYIVKASGGTNPTSVTMTDGSAKTLTVSILTGHTITVEHNLDSNAWQLMGMYTSLTTPTSIQTNPQITASNTADTEVYVYFARSSANKLKYTTDQGGYFYFEDGYFPQSEAKEIIFEIENYGNGVKRVETSFKANEKIYLEVSLEGFISNCGDASVVIDSLKTNHDEIDWNERLGFTEVRYSSLNNKKHIIVTFTAGVSEENRCNRLLLWYAYNGASPDFSNAKIKVKVYRELTSTLNKDAVKSNEKIKLGDVDYEIYTYTNNKYVNVREKWFMFEPIRWRVSEYGVSSTECPTWTWLDKFGSFNSNFTVVSDLVLNVGSAMTKEQFDAKQKDGSWKDWSMADSSLPDLLSGVNVNYAKPFAQQYDKFGGVGSTSVVSGTTTGASSNVRIASGYDVIEWFSDFNCMASDLVKHLLGCGTYASYWTPNLGSQYGAGKIITTNNLFKDRWLYEQAGIRFAMTFNEAVRFI